MNCDRRRFLESSVLGSTILSASPLLGVADEMPHPSSADLHQIAEVPVLKRDFFNAPVLIESIDLLQQDQHYFVSVRSQDGMEGYAVSHNEHLQVLYPILLKRVIPYFIGKDARDLDDLIDGVYLHDSNYKMQGLAFWVCVASVEFALLDLLGQIVGKPVGLLLGDLRQKEIGIYLANNDRGESAEESVRRISERLKKYPAKAIKFKVGGRMSKNADFPPGRTEALIPLLRDTLGEEITLYADSNGSYDVPEAIRIGKLLEKHRIAFYEEPCPFDQLEETRQVAEALAIPIAGGEQESSLDRFRWMIARQAVQIVQPDLFYFGGFVRSIRVARMAAEANMPCIPHMSGVPLGYLYVLHFASCVPNAGQHMEYKGKDDDLPFACDTSSLELDESGKITVPSGPGLGIVLDPDFVKNSKRVVI